VQGMCGGGSELAVVGCSGRSQQEHRDQETSSMSGVHSSCLLSPHAHPLSLLRLSAIFRLSNSAT
jgi:hypothetical protein